MGAFIILIQFVSWFTPLFWWSTSSYSFFDKGLMGDKFFETFHSKTMFISTLTLPKIVWQDRECQAGTHILLVFRRWYSIIWWSLANFFRKRPEEVFSASRATQFLVVKKQLQTVCKHVGAGRTWKEVAGRMWLLGSRCVSYRLELPGLPCASRKIFLSCLTFPPSL